MRFFRMPLHYQIFLALLVGVVAGLALNIGFSRGDTTVALDDIEIQLIASPEVISYSLRTPEGKTLHRQTFPSLAALEERHPRLAAAYRDSTDQPAAPPPVRVLVTDRNVRIVEDLNHIRFTYSGQADGREFVDEFEVADPQDLARKHPEWFGVYTTHAGTLSREIAGWGKAVGDLFLRLLRMISIPLVVTSLITGVTALGDSRRLGKMFGRTMFYYVATSMLAITTGIVMVNVIRPGVGAKLPGSGEAVIAGEDKTLLGVFGELINSMIPPNPLASLAEANFLSIITFSILFGIFTIQVGGRTGTVLQEFFQAAFEVMMKMTMFIMRLAPFGVGAYMLNATASQGPQIFGTLAWYMLAVFCGLVFHAVVTLPLIVKLFSGRSPWKYAQALSPALLTAFSTASSNGTLPITLSSVENRAGVPNRVSSFVLPLGATINMDGTALYEAVAVLFIAQATPGFAMTLETQIIVALTALLASVGAAAIPHAGLVMMAIVLQAVGLPLESQAIIIAVDRVLDMCRTTVNVWSDACGCAVVAAFDEGN